MTHFLVRHFIKNSGDVHDPAVRQRYGMLSGCVGIALNLLLCAGKFLAGVLTSSIAVTADAFNNLSDAGSSIVTLVGFKMAGQKPDPDHPFGHGRIEYLAGLAVSMVIILAGVELGKASFGKILNPSPVDFSVLSCVILACSIAVKLWMFVFNRRLGRDIGSSAMQATAADSLSDTAATAVVLLGTLAGHFFDVTVDGWMGAAVALFIIYSGIGAARDTLNPLLGQKPDPELVQNIADTVLAHKEIVGVHDLIIHDYGPGRCMISLHAEVPCDADILQMHDIIDDVERELQDRYCAAAVIHMDPIATDDELTLRKRAEVAALVKLIDPSVSIHDFRMTAGPGHTNLIFDVVVPHNFRLSDQQISEAIRNAISAMDGGKYYAVVHIDKAYT